MAQQNSETPAMPLGEHFGLIYADPPWQYRDRANAGKRGASHKYDCMDWRQIARLPVPALAEVDCLLAMWWVAPMVHEALSVVDMWGFRLVTMTGLTWAKVGLTGLPAVGMGHWTRGNAENCLFAIRGRPKVVDKGVSQLIVAPRRAHSQKPDEAYERLERLLGETARIELFARSMRRGWRSWGSEIAT